MKTQKKKSNTLAKLFLFAFIAIFISSCSKEEISSVKYPSRMNILINPYDWVGTFHNNAIDAVAADPNFGGLGNEEVFDIVKLYYLDNISEEDEVANMEFDDNIIAAMDTARTHRSELDDAYSNTLISQDVYNAYDGLYDIIENNNLHNGQDLTNLISALNNYEQVILANTYSSTDEKIIFSGIAVARKSAIYWNNAINNSASPWYGSNQANSFWRTIKIIGADIGGAGLGFWLYHGDLEASGVFAAVASTAAGL